MLRRFKKHLENCIITQFLKVKNRQFQNLPREACLNTPVTLFQGMGHLYYRSGSQRKENIYFFEKVLSFPLIHFRFSD